ncbi:MAG TPA: ABC transporter permease [Gammaproteobacteria bacterium]|nr:ABC transporter permease [Gammaproteobacteria bacterium]
MNAKVALIGMPIWSQRMSMIRHLRAARRSLARVPVFTFTVVAMLAVGIGATTAMFSMFHQVLLQRLPVAEPERLVNLGAPGPKWGSTSCGRAGDCEQVFSYPMFRDLEARQTVFAGLAGHRPFQASLAYHDRTLVTAGSLVSGQYFSALGVRPALGRLLGPQDEPQVGESDVVVLSHDYWQDELGADPAVVGQTLRVNGRQLTIVGVAPAGFSGTTLGLKPRLFVPLTLRWIMEPAARNDADNRRSYWIYAFARLAPGVSRGQAAASVNSLYSAILNDVEAPLNSAMPPDVLEQFRHRQVTMEPGERGQSTMASDSGRPLALLLGVAATLLAIVCVNVANLLLARGAARAGELAIRASLGASRRELAAQLLSESLLLAVLGGLASIPVAALVLRAIVALLPVPVANNIVIAVSGAAAAFAACVALGTVVLFGLLPAIQSTRVAPSAVMKGQGSRAVGAQGAARARALLATAQIAFSMALLATSGLFAQSLANIARVNLGMDVDSLVTFSVAPRLSGYEPERADALFDRLERELAEQPGITSVATSRVPLVTDSDSNTRMSIEGNDASPTVDMSSTWNAVSPGLRRTFSIPLLAGRDFTDADVESSAKVAIVNEAFVRKFALGGAAIGKQVSAGSDAHDVTIVGVIADATYSNVKDAPPPQYIVPRHQSPSAAILAFYVRASVPPEQLVGQIQRVVAQIDSTLPLNGLVPMRRVVQGNVYLDRLIAMLSGGFAGLATLLAAIGLYGVLAYGVAQRTRELGLRLALGATAARLRAMVLQQVGLMALAGVPIGLGAALLLGRAARSLLYGLSSSDPWVMAGAVAVLAVVVAAAGYLPARRAAKVAPMEALRYE